MKKYLFVILPFLAAVIYIQITGFTFSESTVETDYNLCVKKYDSKWGDPCLQCTSFNDTYRVFLRNTCTESLDLKCAVQEKDKRWRTFTKLNMAPNDTFVAYACVGLGKYLYWARKNGDRSNEFPSDEEINAQYNK